MDKVKVAYGAEALSFYLNGIFRLKTIQALSTHENKDDGLLKDFNLTAEVFLEYGPEVGQFSCLAS